jgi:hypothetical protein
MIAREYWTDPKATAQGIAGGYWHTGDIGRIDAEGYIHVSDRMKDMLNRGGLKIYSVEVENVLQQYPGVMEAAVVGKPCPVLAERVHAFVYAGGAPLDEARMKALCTQRLSDYKVPNFVRNRALAEESDGKIRRALLAQLIAQMEAAGPKFRRDNPSSSGLALRSARIQLRDRVAVHFVRAVDEAQRAPSRTSARASCPKGRCRRAPGSPNRLPAPPRSAPRP